MNISERKIFFLFPFLSASVSKKNPMTGIAGSNVTSILRALFYFYCAMLLLNIKPDKKNRNYNALTPLGKSPDTSGIRSTECDSHPNLINFLKRKTISLHYRHKEHTEIFFLHEESIGHSILN